MIVSTNKTSYPDTLIVILDQDKGRSKFTEKDQVTRVENEDGEVIGFNFFKDVYKRQDETYWERTFFKSLSLIETSARLRTVAITLLITLWSSDID